MRLIDADDMKKHITGDDYKRIRSIMEWIDNQPTIEPQRMKGKWINNYRCSVCGYGEKNYSDAPNNFCPVCGADMREK